MYRRLLSIFDHYFIKASTIVVTGFFLVNVLNYLFNLIMVRMLDPIRFGEVATLSGLLMVLSVPATTLMRLMSKFVAELQSRQENYLIKPLFKLVSFYGWIVGIVMVIIFILSSSWWEKFLQIEKIPFLIFTLSLLFLSAVSITGGVLQGSQNFFYFSMASVIGVVIKIILSILLVKWGFSVAGVMVALVISSLGSYLYSRWQIRTYLTDKVLSNEEYLIKEITWIDIKSYVCITFFSSLLLMLFFNIDIILAKHYLTPELAGQYAALSIISKIIVYATGAFVSVMFPLVSAAKVSGDGREKGILRVSFLITLVVSVTILMVFVLLPNVMIKTLFGSNYLGISYYLYWFGLAMVFSSLSQVFINYFMAIHDRKYIYSVGAIVVFELVTIYFFHNNIKQIIIDVLSASLLMLIVMLVVYWRRTGKKITANWFL